VKVSKVTSRVVVVEGEDIDTDRIIPARFLKGTVRTGLGVHLFADWPTCPVHDPASAGAQILVAGRNFGCGSSREHAPWALLDRGFRAVIAPAFADIFRGNALKNGVLPIELDVRLQPGDVVTVDLESETVTLPGGETRTFHVDPFARRCLLQGVDELGYLLSKLPEVETYEAR
jgi:3-isopropylmalate/(R)-2-methylmalate dehydratase small subunit